MPEPRIDTPNGALTLLQDRFVDEFVSNGGDGRAAAQAAGYGSQRIDHRVAELMRHPVVTAEIVRRSSQMLAQGAPLAAATLMRLIARAKSEYVQFQAAKDLLDRLGLRAPERQEYQVTGDLKVIIDLGPDDPPRLTAIGEADPRVGSPTTRPGQGVGVENRRLLPSSPTARGFFPARVQAHGASIWTRPRSSSGST
jgi:hypothetical protein